MATDPALERLRKIKHVVVLMMENRSFDQMLGYLSLEDMPEVDGLTGDERNLDAEGNEYRVFEFGEDETAFHRPGQPFDKSLDPCHAPDCVLAQIANGNGGFVENFIEKKKPPPEHRRLPMGYYTATHLPMYDFLAHQYCVCDAWHSSIPGDTWPNRLFALTGRTAKPVGHKLPIFQDLKNAAFLRRLRKLPIYEAEAFTRHLRDDQWRWYSHDPASLRLVDVRYRSFVHPDRGNFAYFNRKEISLAQEAAEALIVGDSFLDDAAKGELRDVSWIDPNFIDLRVFDPMSNDDHPPSDVTAGQQLVLDLYDALLNSRDWEDTLLVIVYDEHGGFYDHVHPPPANDGSSFPTYGLRVPALVVGPRVKRFVCKELLDHTSLIKTILLRFAPHPEEAIAKMKSKRLRNARHLGVVLEDEPRTEIASHEPVRQKLADWRRRARTERRAAGPGQPSVASDGAGQPHVLTDLQEEFALASLTMRRLGLPAGQP